MAFKDRFTLIEPPNPYGSGFQGALKVATSEELTVQVMANFEEVPLEQLVPSRRVPGIRRVGIFGHIVELQRNRREAIFLNKLDELFKSPLVVGRLSSSYKSGPSERLLDLCRFGSERNCRRHRLHSTTTT